jgi:isopenicillin N synthase-like dioxygenase
VSHELPVIDVAPLLGRGDSAAEGRVARALDAACREHGFFYAAGHRVDRALEARLEACARAFFAQPDAEKARVRMALGGRAWRGWFPVGGELTSGEPDLKEGLYFGTELGPDDERVRAGTPLHGANLFPPLPGFRETVLEWMAAMTQLGHALMRGLALALGLEREYFAERHTGDPFLLFRIFHYPAETEPVAQRWGVGEHTDYGVLTILKQDEAGGLEVRTRSGWLAVPPLPGTFVCNLGDMLDRMTGGRFRSTPHRVRNTSGRSRFSYPFFFDPSFDAPVAPLPLAGPPPDDAAERWDGASPHRFEGTYGDYLLAKVARVFPDLGHEVLGPDL